jgi:hypothetical protein
MLYLTLPIFILGIIAAVISFRNKNESSQNAAPPLRPDGCCGRHAVCEHANEPKANAACAADYYDDEELDRFRNRKANDYSKAEIEEFRDVLYSLAKGEAEGWLGSLEKRGLRLPAALLSDAAIIVAEDKEEAQL